MVCQTFEEEKIRGEGAANWKDRILIPSAQFFLLWLDGGGGAFNKLVPPLKVLTAIMPTTPPLSLLPNEPIKRFVMYSCV